jgi:hypothetical protein
MVTTIEPLSSFLAASDSGYVAIVSSAGTSVVSSFEEYPITSVGGYCVFACNEAGEPSGVLIGFIAGEILASSFTTPLADSITGIAFDADGIMVDNPSLLVGPFILPESPAITGFALNYPVVGTVDLSAAGPNLDSVAVVCSGGASAGFVNNIILPTAHVITLLRYGFCILPESVVDTLANALDAGIPGGEVDETGTSSAGPSAASQVNRQALYDNGWTLPASWTADLVL